MAVPYLPIPYTRGDFPTLPGGDTTYVREELSHIQATLDAILTLLPQGAVAAPKRLRHGMVRRSMAPWWPVSGQAADKWVWYDADLPGWAYLP